MSPVVTTRLVVIGPAGNWRTSINGVSPDYFTIRDWTATSGDVFVDADVKAARKIAVLGATVAKNLFPGVDAVGAQIQIGHVPFTVSGVLAAKGQNATGSDQDDVILMPYTTAQNRLSGNVRLGQILVSTVLARATSRRRRTRSRRSCASRTGSATTRPTTSPCATRPRSPRRRRARRR